MPAWVKFISSLSFIKLYRIVLINDRWMELPAKTRNVYVLWAMRPHVCVCWKLLSALLCSLVCTAVRACIRISMYPCTAKMLWLKAIGAPYFNHSYGRKKEKKRRPFEFGRSWKIYCMQLFASPLPPIHSSLSHVFVSVVFSMAILLITAQKSI